MGSSGEELIYREFAPGDEICLAEIIKEVFGQFLANEVCAEDTLVFLKSQEPRSIYFRFLFRKIFIILAQEKKQARGSLDSSIAGFIEVENYSHISLLFVKKEHQRQGIATRLLKEAIKKCRISNPSLKIVTLNSTPHAREFYERLGFEKTNKFFGNPAKNSIPMILLL